MTTCLTCPEPLPRSREAVLRVRWGSGEQNNAAGGRGLVMGAQVRHVVTYRDPPNGTLIYTVFTKKCQKRSTKGVPPVFELAPPT